MKNESGRSMVEMLGVLAIIGVLSVGGIAGYTMAMRKYKANEVANAMSQCGVVGLAHDASGASGNADCSSFAVSSATSLSYASNQVTATVESDVCTTLNGMGKITCSDTSATLSLS